MKALVSFILGAACMFALIKVRHARAKPAVNPLAYWREDRMNRISALSNTAPVLMLGDSRIEQGEWSELLGVPVANRGVGFDTGETMLKRLPLAIGPNTKVCVIEIGINDVNSGVSNSVICDRITEAVSMLASNRIKAIVAPVIPARWNNVDSLNQMLAQKCSGVFLRNLHITTNELSRDGLHLNGAGYRLFAEAVKAELH
jgi:lysophospholipase L1-like esterase